MNNKNQDRVALVYCRVSSERQKVEGHGLESQEHRCREFADRKSYPVEKVFKDSYSGGGDFMNRPAMAEMLAYIDSKPHKNFVVIFDDLKRFARDTVFHMKLKMAFKARNVLLLCLNFNFEDTPEGEFVETIFAAQGQLEREQNKRQVIQKMKARLERGYWPFFPPPAYEGSDDPIHGRLLIPNSKAPLVKEAFEGFASGRFQEQVDVQNFLRLNDFLDGTPIYLGMVKRLLTRVIYAGYIEYPDWEVSRRKGYHQPIISLETFEKVQDKLNGRAKVHTRKDTRTDFPLRGFVCCGTCHEPMTASWSTNRIGKKFAYYRCRNSLCAQRTKSIPRVSIESPFEGLLRSIKPSEEVLALTKAIMLKVWEAKSGELIKLQARTEKDLITVQNEVRDLVMIASKTKNEKVLMAYETQIVDLTNKELLIKEKINNPKIKNVDFEKALDVVWGALGNPYLMWSRGDLLDKRTVLKLVFNDKITFDREKGFGTPDLALPLRVFELSRVDSFQGVETRGIEPRCI